eukprot:6207649-Pleurochrysis_carterae.AAC.1
MFLGSASLLVYTLPALAATTTRVFGGVPVVSPAHVLSPHELAHAHWRAVLEHGGPRLCVVDATAGNGRDTLRLLECLALSGGGVLWACDVQADAISSAQAAACHRDEGWGRAVARKLTRVDRHAYATDQRSTHICCDMLTSPAHLCATYACLDDTHMCKHTRTAAGTLKRADGMTGREAYDNHE